MTLPGWNSIDAAARWHRGFEIAGFVALGLLLLFEVIAYVYGNRKDVLVAAAEQVAARAGASQNEEANQQRDAEIAEANRRAAEAEAQTRQLQQQAAPRALSQVERNRITAFLAGKPAGAFVVKASVVAPDARAYADEIATLFRTAGWDVRVDNAMFTGTGITGLWITVQNGRAAPPAAGVLQGALAAGGLHVRGVEDASREANDIWLSVGAK